MALVELERDQAVATIVLNRPEKLNAFTGTMRDDLLRALEETAADRTCRCVVVTGAGRGFCAGGDIEAMAALQRERDTARFRELLDAGAAIVTRIASMAKPVIAAINGVAAGAGCNLALACDYRIASEGAKMGETFVRIGLHPDWGGTWFLPRLVGPSRSFELMTTGRMVDAQEALAIGMIDRVVAEDEVIETARELARELAAGPPQAIAAIKRSLHPDALDGLAKQLELEAQRQLEAFLSTDSAEGMAGFFEKRRPRFGGD